MAIEPVDFLFDPQVYSRNDDNLTMANHTLSLTDLEAYGKRATALRKHFTDESLKAVTGSNTVV